MKEKIIRDDKGRILFKISDRGEIVVGRFPDMSDEMKNFVLDLFTSFTDGDPVKLKNFLDYKIESDEFCV